MYVQLIESRLNAFRLEIVQQGNKSFQKGGFLLNQEILEASTLM